MSVTATNYVTETEAIIKKLRRAADHIVTSNKNGAYDDLERPIMSSEEAKRVFHLMNVTMEIEQIFECLTEKIRHASDYLGACASGILEGGRDGDRDLSERCDAAYRILIERSISGSTWNRRLDGPSRNSTLFSMTLGTRRSPCAMM
jgi:hypothetical protein